MIFKILFYGFLLYLGYRLVFHFILPIYRTTRQVKRGFREMHERMNSQFGQQPGAAPGQAQPHSTGKTGTPNAAGDYIEFEEIK